MQKIHKKTILLIDDDPYILQIVQTCLEVFSEWKLAIADSAKKGLEEIFRSKPDAILLDMMMPNIDGFAFLKYSYSQLG
jgi:CheY-like chemotaxis protein